MTKFYVQEYVDILDLHTQPERRIYSRNIMIYYVQRIIMYCSLFTKLTIYLGSFVNDKPRNVFRPVMQWVTNGEKSLISSNSRSINKKTCISLIPSSIFIGDTSLLPSSSSSITIKFKEKDPSFYAAAAYFVFMGERYRRSY